MSNAIDHIKPRGERILCERVQPPQRVGEIIIPDNIKQRLRKWKVLAIGDKVENIKVGDIVLISWFLGVPVDIIYEDIPTDHYKFFMAHEVAGDWKE